MKEDLQGELIVVTGASSGVGYALTRELAAREGATVVAIARRRVFRLEALARQVGGDKLFSVTADLSMPGEADKLADMVKARWGTPSALVHAINRSLRSPSLHITETEWDLTMQVNVKSALYSVQAFAPLMREAGRGVVVVHNPTPHYTDEFCGSEAVAVAAASTLSAFVDGWSRQFSAERVVVREVDEIDEDECHWNNYDRAGHDIMLLEEIKSGLEESDTANNWAKYGQATVPEEMLAAVPETSVAPMPVPEAASALAASLSPMVLSTRGCLALTDYSLN